uniref:Uncharacterized protein n=1 Tax=Ditylenchus dipsaci TaxID=166011 RepID=A0A915DX16_9BILA
MCDHSGLSSTSMSCFQASQQKKGCCLQVLKPNETGCVLDEQCRRACETSFCDHNQYPSRCMCDQDRHFLFNKCCKFIIVRTNAPTFAHSDPVIDNDGFSRCVLRIDPEGSFKYIRRHRRQLRSSYC